MLAKTRTELDRIRVPFQRQRIEWAANNSGVSDGDYRVYFIRLLRHKLGHKDRHGDRIPWPVPPGKLNAGELAYIEQAVDRAHKALEPTEPKPGVRRIPDPPPKPVRPRPTGILPDSVARVDEDFDF